MVGKVNRTSSQPATAAETTDVNHVSEKQTKTPSELHKGDSESSPIKASASQISSRKAEQSLEGLARQAGLFNYVLPQNSTNSAGPDSVTMAVGEDGGEQPKLPKLPDLPPTPGGTTMAVGEEDGGLDPNPKPGGGGFTTMAVGEEDGGEQPKLPEPDPPTTPGERTTMATGEEDGTTTVGGV
ncbi:hypothetical protein L0244_27640 [bacterium]|nr:hypothetical protein [bacterium]